MSQNARNQVQNVIYNLAFLSYNIIDDKLCITSVDGKKCNIELTSMANFSDIKYWTAKLEGKKVTRIWTADKDILKESKLKEYKYGDQKNIFTLLSKNYIGYYDMNTAI